MYQIDILVHLSKICSNNLSDFVQISIFAKLVNPSPELDNIWTEPYSIIINTKMVLLDLTGALYALV